MYVYTMYATAGLNDEREKSMCPLLLVFISFSDSTNNFHIELKIFYLHQLDKFIIMIFFVSKTKKKKKIKIQEEYVFFLINQEKKIRVKKRKN